MQEACNDSVAKEQEQKNIQEKSYNKTSVL
jgi:hypothetical protein